MLLFWALFGIFVAQYFVDGLISEQQNNNRTLIVLAAPSIWDVNYADDFVPIVEFQIRLVRILNEFESAILLADRHTMPYLDGRIKLLAEHLPADRLLEANIYDINLHDFAPLGTLRRAKFVYRNDEWAEMASKQVDDSINRFLVNNRIRGHHREPDIVLSGRDVVDNGVNRALLSKSVIWRNAGRLSEWSLMRKMQNAFGKVIVVPAPSGPGWRLDDVLAFIEPGVLAMAGGGGKGQQMDLQVASTVHVELFKREKSKVTVVELPPARGVSANGGDEGNCGLYTALLATERFVFVPLWGNDPSNWPLGYSRLADKLAVHLIETNSRKQVVAVNVPREICRRGLSLRSLSWTIRGGSAISSVVKLINKMG